ncbi:MAG TPA: response regulator [Alphaproteobacteria bacterium]|nr:response regulator [Alphaproteobacteria bacterium]HOO50870.1 response regulator [Alphaproteobacteria bacterium]
MPELTRKIVLIEDSETDSFVIKRVIRENPCAKSYKILSFDSMSQAREYLSLHAEEVDAILLDLHLPDTVDAYDTYAQVRDFAPDTPIVALTSCNNYGLAMDLVRDGVGDYVSKSHILKNPDLLCRAIDFALCRHVQNRAVLGPLNEELEARVQLLSQMV